MKYHKPTCAAQQYTRQQSVRFYPDSIGDIFQAEVGRLLTLLTCGVWGDSVSHRHIGGVRIRPTREYLVRWARPGQDDTWEPIQNLHAQIVNDYEHARRGQAPCEAEGAPQECNSDPSALYQPTGTTIVSTFSASVKSQASTPTAAPSVASCVAPDPQTPDTVQQSSAPTVPPGTAASATPSVVGTAAADVVGGGRLAAPGTSVSSSPDTAALEAIAKSYRHVLQYLEPLSWTATQSSTKNPAMSLTQLAAIPLEAFLKVYQHSVLELVEDHKCRAEVAERQLVEAQQRAEKAEDHLEALTRQYS
eukprot:m.608395 g.608395  ORF g.608395 m.608395 type:complete len:305 (-) comp22485_c0_seq1:173-1087(-)